MSPATEQIIATLTTIVATELDVPAETVAPDTDLRGMPGADSVKVLRVIAKIEREYDVELDDEDVFSVSSIEDVADIVHRVLAEQAA